MTKRAFTHTQKKTTHEQTKILDLRPEKTLPKATYGVFCCTAVKQTWTIQEKKTTRRRLLRINEIERKNSSEIL